MLKINFYQTQPKEITRTFCKLSEKCYQSNLNTLVITKNKSHLQNIDKSLWTYSKKTFIPHGTIDDPRPSDQPILITTSLQNINKARVFIFFDPTKEVILESMRLISPTELSQIEKMIFIINRGELFDAIKIKHLLYLNSICTDDMNHFFQDGKLDWEKCV